jgi:hypothetical protein
VRAAGKIALNAALIGAVVLAAAMSGPGNGSVTVISPQSLGFPGAFAVIANAGGAVISEGGTEAIASGYSADPEFASRLRREGALLVFNMPGAPGCSRKD